MNKIQKAYINQDLNQKKKSDYLKNIRNLMKEICNMSSERNENLNSGQ